MCRIISLAMIVFVLYNLILKRILYIFEIWIYLSALENLLPNIGKYDLFSFIQKLNDLDRFMSKYFEGYGWIIKNE